MARRRRLWIEGGIYHLFSRGSNRQAIFLNGGDYLDFEGVFSAALLRRGIDCFGWSFMPNHWHTIVRCPPTGLSGLMQGINHRYALRFNRRWDRTAHVFTNRFGAVFQESEEQFLWTLRYLVRNPLEAGICASVQDGRWTSFAATAGLAPAPPQLRVKEILAHFGNEADEARRRYVEFVSAKD